MRENYESNQSDNTSSNSLKRGSRFEHDRVFAQAFTKYNLLSNRFKKSTNLKYVDQVGGVPVGQYNDGEDILVDSSDSHTLIIGSTGSKKSRLIVMPSIYILGHAGESMIVSDPKAEIYERTADFLSECGYKIQIVNLRDPSIGNSWNPLSIPYSFYKNGDMDKACEFVNDIAVNLMLSEKSVKDPYWDYSAGDLFFGLTLLLFRYCNTLDYPDEVVNISNLLRLRQYLFQSDNYTKSFFVKLIYKDEIIASSLMGTIEAPDKTKSCILSVFDEKMRSFMIQPNLLEMLSNSSVSMDFICDTKTIVYLIMPDEKTSYHKLVTLFIKQSYEYLIYKAQTNLGGKMKIRLNYILDEFSSLPTIKDFPAMITAARSRNIRFNLIIQSKHQLLERYKEETETIQSNCSNWIFFTSREVKLLQELSLLCGKRSNGEKYIVPPDSLQHLSKERGEALILSGRLYPYITILADIDRYDGGRFRYLEIEKEPRNTHAFIKFGGEETDQVPLTEERRVIEENEILETDFDLQKALEVKFDELFGSADDEAEGKK